MKIVSWNVNGIRAVAKKNFFEDFKEMDADILCLQETKAQDNQVAEVLEKLDGYTFYSNSAVKKGYSGTAIISKTEPILIIKGIGIEEHDNEGRVLTAEYDNFYLVNVYVPNSKSDLSRLDYRTEWDAEFLKFLKNLEEKKEIVVCGDFNVAHTNIDLARPKPNYNKSAGFTQKEIDGMDNFTEAGLKDTFRYLYPDATEKYTWWSYRGGARTRNVGWRIDYFLASETILSKLKDATIYADVLGSDHCPVGVEW
ncbi:MAG: exodeoxyribonuclease III [Ichthyobacteriaceae bacterium]|nr:exodeoxyribonuclease III [Ichthyobacteriaceae bacterium]